MDIVRRPAGEGPDPAIDDRYMELFKSKPRSLKDQKAFGKHMQSAASQASSMSHDHLGRARHHLTRAMCSLGTGQITPETANIVFTQSQEAYLSQVLSVMRHAGAKATQRFAGDGTRGELIRSATSFVVEQEAIDRLRELDSAFLDAFGEVNKRRPPLERVRRFAGFVASYPSRPSHELLEGHQEQDIPAAQVAYGVMARLSYLQAFDVVTDTARITNQPPDINRFIEDALRESHIPGLMIEAGAAIQAVEGALK